MHAEPKTLAEAKEIIEELRYELQHFTGDDESLVVEFAGMNGCRAIVLRTLYRRYPKATGPGLLMMTLEDGRELRRLGDVDDGYRVTLVHMSRLRKLLRERSGIADGVVGPKPGISTGYILTAEAHAWITERLACPPST